MSRLTIEAWPVTDAGGETNDDTILVYQPEDERERRYSGSLYIVADGSGGAEQAGLASRYAAERIAAAYYNSDEPDLGRRLREAVKTANEDIFEYAKMRPELVKMNTTVTAMVVRGEQIHVANVGDSRAYLVRDGDISQITRDHTLVQQLIDEGAIDPDEAAEHPRAEVVLRALGSEPEVTVDVFDIRLKPDDALLLTTDGLTRRVGDEEILRVMSTQSPRNAADSLIQRARLKGGNENTSVVTALVRDGAPPMTAGTLPFTWDGTPPSFEARKTLPGTGETPAPDLSADEPAVPPGATQVNPRADQTTERPSPVIEEPPIPPDATQQQQPPAAEVAPPPTQQPRPTQQAPQRQQQQEPAPQYQPPTGYQPYTGGEIDPVTGLPPTGGQPQQQAPPQYQQQQYQQQQYQQQQQQPPPPYGGQQQYGAPSGYPAYGPLGYDPNQQGGGQRGVPLAVFAVVGIMAVLLTIVLIFLLVNPFGFSLPTLAGGGDTTPDAAVSDGGAVQPTTDPGGGVQPTAATDGETGTTDDNLEGPIASPVPGGDGGTGDGGTGDIPTPTPPPAPAAAAPPGMELIEGGAFLRGVPDEEIDSTVTLCIDEDTTEGNVNCIREYFTDAQPVEEVTISPFYMDIFEVTNAAYAQCVAAEICTTPADTTFFDDAAFANHPVVFVDWNQATEYCEFVGKRLPTEAEWEKAARWDPILQDAYIFPWGDGFNNEANIAGVRGQNGGTTPVNEFTTDISPWGVIGMGGNVREWVQDWYFPGYQDRSQLNPSGPASAPLANPQKVVRGGSFLSLQSYSRSGHRLDINVNSQEPDIGFRCVADQGADVGGGTVPTLAPTNGEGTTDEGQATPEPTTQP